MSQLTGLFLGAGASYEAGMPLVWELTRELKAWLTPEKLRQFNHGWRQQGGGHPDSVIEDFVSVLQRADLHYESLLGFLETQFRRHQQNQQDYHGLYSWLVQMVYAILYARHVRNSAFLARHLRLYEGIKALAKQSEPLWVFSLNHDLIVEMLAATFDIPLHSGFSQRTVSLPRRDKSGTLIGELRANMLSEEELTRGSFFYPNPPESGIYLLKIHGALDVFTFNEGKDVLKLVPEERSLASILDMLRGANEELFYPLSASPNGRANATNEIAYADESGVMQFLRRSLLAGAYKFDTRHSQVLPHAILRQFVDNINFVSRLVCVGYGLGDLHINSVIRHWLEFTSVRHLEIVNPGVTEIPAFLLHLAPQITLVGSGAADYFDSVAGITRTRREKLEKRLAAYARKHGAEQTSQEMKVFQKADLSESVGALYERMKAAFARGPKAGQATAEEMLAAELEKQTDDMLERTVEYLEKPKDQ
ncbi:hypothetical protein ACTJLB_09005 [Paraburkholderia sp. 22098]|uniref:hypothetical protein n=1 Tax=Paraburkholderia sp. 22098 TaxID=3453874 RepID=UPI003F83E85E